MSYASAALALLERFAGQGPLPRVRALHLPPEPTPGEMRGVFCALELEGGALGLTYLPPGDTWAELTRLQQHLAHAGREALDVARGYGSADTLIRTVGFAAVNALTRCLYDRAGFVPPASGDSIGNIDPRPGETIGMIGYFPPLVARVTASGAGLVVVELRRDLVGERDGAHVTLDATELESCDKVLATGALLLNDTLDAMLAHCRNARRFALIGPSVGSPADPLLAHGVTLLGGSWVTDCAAFVDALRSGDPTGHSARKFALAQADYPGWDALLVRAARG